MDHLLIFILAALVVAIFIVVRRYKILVYELNNSLELINNINTDCDFKESQLKASLPATSSINHAIASISNELRKQVSVINERGCEVDKKNTELEDAYVQLETSYGQLETLEQRYHSLVINIPDIVLTLDESGIITYANRACRDILNFRRHDIVGKPFNYLIYGGYAKLFNFEHLKDTVEKNGEQQMELPLRKKEGSDIQSEVKFSPAIGSPSEHSIQAIIRDVTEQNNMKNLLIENNYRLEIINEFSHKMASSMELEDIYGTCVNTLTRKLGFDGAIYFTPRKKGDFYHIEAFSGNYFKEFDILDYLTYIHFNVRPLLKDEKDGVVFDYNEFTQTFLPNNNTLVFPAFNKAFAQEVDIGGSSSEILLVITNQEIKHEDLDVVHSICHTTSVAVKNAMYLTKSKENYVQTIDALIAAVEARDQYTIGHSQRVANLTVKIASEMGMEPRLIEDLRIAGILHDIGKIGVSDRILLKDGPLTKIEFEEIKKHPAISNKILYPIGLSDVVLKAVAFHHERYDGKGYPFGLANESIGIEPQIISVADAFDSMTSKRPYREPLSKECAINELIDNRGTQFHPKIVDVMVEIQRMQ